MVFLIGLSLVISRLPGFSQNQSYSRLFLFLLLVFVVNIIWSVFSTWGVELTRTSSATRKQVGDIFSESFEIVNRSFIPKAWLKITDRSEFLSGAGSRVLTWIGGSKPRTYLAYATLNKRGWFDLGPTQIESGDLFGMLLFRKKVEPKSRLLVIPHTFDITKFAEPFGTLPGGQALRQKTLEMSPYAAGVREYVQGDPLKRIHWPTSARKQALIVKEFEKDPLAEVWIFLDVRGNVHVHQDLDSRENLGELWWLTQRRAFTLPPDTGEYAISIAASIAKYYIRQKREVGLVSIGKRYSILRAERGERQMGKILETLAVLPIKGDLPLWGLISSQITHFARGSTIVLITPSAEEKVLTVARELQQRRLKPVVILIDGASFGDSRSSEELSLALANRGIVSFLIRKDDNIRSVLEAPQFALENRT
ncbi:MAG: DUF58 domain-containing protein [Brevefilum sp.]|jgi:uncharacterized protein (DUF58 family)